MVASATHLVELRGDSGSGPPLLYIPGIDGSGELLLGTASRLETDFRVVRCCYRVRGPVPTGGDTYEDLAASIIRILDRAKIDRTLVLAESFGGAVAFRLALDHPERVSALAIVNSFVHYEATLRLRLTRAVLRIIPSSLYAWCRYLFAPLVLFAPRSDPTAIREFRSAPLLKLESGYLRRMQMVAGLDLRDSIERLTLPVQLFASTHDRVIDSVRSATDMAARLSGAEVTTIQNAGHVVLPLSEEPWLERMRELRERVEGRSG